MRSNPNPPARLHVPAGGQEARLASRAVGVLQALDAPLTEPRHADRVSPAVGVDPTWSGCLDEGNAPARTARTGLPVWAVRIAHALPDGDARPGAADAVRAAVDVLPARCRDALALDAGHGRAALCVRRAGGPGAVPCAAVGAPWTVVGHHAPPPALVLHAVHVVRARIAIARQRGRRAGPLAAEVTGRAVRIGRASGQIHCPAAGPCRAEQDD
jgi:hypothetical protein